MAYKLCNTSFMVYKAKVITHLGHAKNKDDHFGYTLVVQLGQSLQKE